MGQRPERGLLVSNIAVLLFGLAGVLGKLSTLPVPLIVLGRVFFAGIVLGGVVLARRVDMRARNRRDLALLIGQGVLLAVHWTAFFASIAVSNVAIGLLAFSSFPLFTAGLEPLLLRQRANRVQTAAALVILFGIYLLVPSFSLANAATLGVVLGLFAGATFALLSVVNRGLGTSYPSLTISFYQDGIAALVLLPTLFFLPTTGFFTLREIGILLLLGIGCTAIAHTLFIAGMRDITAQLASLFGSLEPVWGILFALLLLQEIPSTRTLLGGGIILAATIAPLFFQRGKREKPLQKSSH
ncbi:MAG: DMT family transporter [Ktedonobacteraceae bacterium]|nr:DMT family transporter [Ktedonobacteraceae bacterium]